MIIMVDRRVKRGMRPGSDGKVKGRRQKTERVRGAAAEEEEEEIVAR